MRMADIHGFTKRFSRRKYRSRPVWVSNTHIAKRNIDLRPLPKYQPLPLGSLAKFFVTQRISPLDQIVEFDNDPRFYLEKTTKKDRRKIIILLNILKKSDDLQQLGEFRHVCTG